MRPLARIRATDLRSREFGAAFGAAGVNGEVARHSAQRAPRRGLGGFSGHGHVQIGPSVGPSSRQMGMGQHLAVVGELPRDAAEGPRLEQLAACPVQSVRDRRSYKVARRFQCHLAFSGSSRATIELQFPNPIVGEIMSPKGSWRPHARRPSRPSRRSNDPYFGAIRFKPVLRTWLARRRHPRYTTDVAPCESNADHWITAPSPCWVIDACTRGSSDKAITLVMVI